MNKDYMDKLMSDIQNYLREENGRKQRERRDPSPCETLPAQKKPFPRPFFIGLITLFSACAIGSITVAMLLLGFLGVHAADSVGVVWLLGAAACGIFFSTVLVSIWKRLVILSQIERNTRLILATRYKTNALLESFIEHIT